MVEHFFSPDSKNRFRSSRPTTKEEVDKYKGLLQKGLVEPTSMEIYTCNIDGYGTQANYRIRPANWAPFYPSERKQNSFHPITIVKKAFLLTSL